MRRKSIYGDRLSIAIIGCGAIAETHLNILKKKNVNLVAAVDSNLNLAIDTAQRYGFEIGTDDYNSIIGNVQAAIICLPNHLHRPVALNLMSNGVDVFCEKPLATTRGDADKMVGAAKKNGRVLSVGNVRRYYWANKCVKRIIVEQTLGELESIVIDEGSVFSWPTKSGFFFNRRSAGGGVLMDIGSHVLDLVLWWMGEYPVSICYQDDNFGGVEADAELELKFSEHKSATIRLSRLRNLQNQYYLLFEKGAVELKPDVYSEVAVVDNSGSTSVLHAQKPKQFEYYFEEMIDDFLLSATTGKKPNIDAAEVANSIQLIEDCYTKAKRLQYSWLKPFQCRKEDTHD